MPRSSPLRLKLLMDNPPTAFDPVQIGPLRLRNRFIKSATNEGMAPNGVPSKLLVDHHQAIAAGGAGMTTVAYCAVNADGRTFVDQIEMNRQTLPHLRVLTDAVHAQGGAACAQITHGGAFNFLPELYTRYPRSSSGGINPAGIMVGRYFKKAMSETEMHATADAFADAAKLAREAGFDAVEIHMGHGYLLSQFISPAYNKRRDQYGGDATERARFPAEVLRSVLDAIGNDLAVICKLSTVEGFKGGAVVDDTIAVGRVLQDAGAHLLVLSAGMNVETPWAIFGSPLPPAAMSGSIANPFLKAMAGLTMRLRQPQKPFEPMYILEHSRRVRAALQMPLAYLGGVQSMDGVEQAMADGFECVVMGRALIHDPDLVNQFQAGSTRESGCTACNECVALMHTPGGTACILKQPNDPARNRQPAAA